MLTPKFDVNPLRVLHHLYQKALPRRLNPSSSSSESDRLALGNKIRVRCDLVVSCMKKSSFDCWLNDQVVLSVDPVDRLGHQRYGIVKTLSAGVVLGEVIRSSKCRAARSLKAYLDRPECGLRRFAI